VSVCCRLFTEAEVQEINSTTIKDVILAVTNITSGDIQDNPFFLDGTWSFFSSTDAKTFVLFYCLFL